MAMAIVVVIEPDMASFFKRFPATRLFSEKPQARFRLNASVCNACLVW